MRCRRAAALDVFRWSLEEARAPRLDSDDVPLPEPLIRHVENYLGTNLQLGNLTGLPRQPAHSTTAQQCDVAVTTLSPAFPILSGAHAPRAKEHP
jgi:hypothetical protein